jgi:WhiB family redox-sensing transcriptional regulator
MSHVLGSQTWMLRGACRQVDPELFFPIAVKGPAERQVREAKAVCSACAVRPDCLSYALAAMPEGIWGGTTPQERQAGLRTRMHRAGLAAHRVRLGPGDSHPLAAGPAPAAW